MDSTFISVFGFSVVLLVSWGIAGLWLIGILRGFYLSTKDYQETGEVNPGVWKKHRRQAMLFAVYIVLVLFYTNHESVYRPKIVITNPAQSQLNAEMREIDNAQKPVIKKSAPMTPIGTGVEKAFEYNRERNQKARDSFNSL